MCEENYLTEVVNDIINHYSYGQVITHKWLKRRCGLEQLKLEDYENISDFLDAFKMQQFQYMTLVDNIRSIMIESYSCYLKNDRGIGYVILDPKDQTQFGYDRFIDKNKKLIRETGLIMNNVRSVSSEQQAKDNDLRAKFASLKMMLETIKKQ